MQALESIETPDSETDLCPGERVPLALRFSELGGKLLYICGPLTRTSEHLNTALTVKSTGVLELTEIA